MLITNSSDILKLHRLPGRINAEQTASLLGVNPHDVPVLVTAKLLKPLGNPHQAAPKWFSSSVIECLRQDAEFLSKATQAISRHWQRQNARARAKKFELKDHAA